MVHAFNDDLQWVKQEAKNDGAPTDFGCQIKQDLIQVLRKLVDWSWRSAYQSTPFVGPGIPGFLIVGIDEGVSVSENNC
jgi:hypothetical protein